jgi:hypothetical protein
MAGDWIKMRGALLDHPKVIAMTRLLQQNKDFREWLTPGGGGDMNGKIVSDPASRAVTTACLLRVWSAAREHGKFDGDDLHLEHSWTDDIDQLAGCPGFGLAMSSVGWVIGHPTKRGVILPNFKEFNVPMTEAERAKEYRERKKNGITKPSRTQRDEKRSNVTTRVEKSRDNNNTMADEPSGVWKEGLDLLLASGLSEREARSFIGMCVKQWEEPDIRECLFASVGKADPAAYCRKLLNDKPRKRKLATATGEVLTKLRQQYGDGVRPASDGKGFWHEASGQRFTLTGERIVG